MIGRRGFSQVAAIAASALAVIMAGGNTTVAPTVAAIECQAVPVAPLPTLGIWQLPWKGGVQSMGYRVTTGSYTLAIDGGMPHDAPALAAAIGTKVNAWVITHPHIDHVGALTTILRTRPDISIGTVYGSLPSVAWVRQYEPAAEADLVNLLAALAARNIPVTPLTLGQRLYLGGLQVDVLGVANPDLTVNAVNNSSVALRVAGNNRGVMFLGDLGPEGGRKLLAGPTASLLPSDTVQMAHHGQNGVTREVYVAIGARTYMWPTPRWLWDDDNGGGVGSGPWDTLTVRGWTSQLGATRHVIAWRDPIGDQLA